MGTERGSHLSWHACPSDQSLFCPHGFQGLEHHPSQSCLGEEYLVPLPGVRLYRCWQGLSAKAWGWENRSGERSAVRSVDTAVGMGMRRCTDGNVPRGSVVYLESKVTLLRGVQGVGPPPHPHSCSCLCRHWEGLPPERVHPSLLQMPAAPCRHRQLAHNTIVAAISLPSLIE